MYEDEDFVGSLQTPVYNNAMLPYKANSVGNFLKTLETSNLPTATSVINPNTVGSYFAGMGGRLPDAPTPVAPVNGLSGILTNFINKYNPLKTSTTTNPVADAGKDTNWNNMAFSSKLGFGLGALSSALDAISAHRAYKLGKSQLNAQKEQFNRQFEAQKGLINSQLYDKQVWRNRNMPNEYMSPSEYLDKYGVK